MDIPMTGVDVATLATILGKPLKEARVELNRLVCDGKLEADRTRHGWFLPPLVGQLDSTFRQAAPRKIYGSRETKCEFCGKLFTSTKSKQGVWKRYCRDSCRNGGRMRKMSKFANEWRNCPICGIQFRGPRQICHDPKCRLVWAGGL